MHLAQLLVRQARLAGDRPAIFHGPHRWATHAQWAARCAGLAQRLRQQGLQPGERVLIFMRNHPRYLEILWGAWWAGLAVVPVNAKLHPSEVEWIVDNAGARWGFVTADVAPAPQRGLQRQVDAESAEADALLAPLPDWSAYPPLDRAPDDLAWLFYTSGTTGRPKGVMLTQRNLMTMGLTYFADVDPIDPGDAIVYGGAPMYLADIERALRVMGPRFVQIYGQGESPMVITALARRHLTDTGHPRHRERLASVGVAQTPVQVRVVDAHGRDLPLGEAGEVLVRGDTVMAGYWRNPEATAAALRDGWLWTGDVGALDADGFLTLKDRSKDLVISGGSNIYPREVEEVLLTAPGVAEVAVVGAPDPEWGEVVVAFVVAQPGAAPSAEALDAHCLAHIARFKRPKRYVFVDALPKNHYGKVLKTELRARLSASA